MKNSVLSIDYKSVSKHMNLKLRVYIPVLLTIMFFMSYPPFIFESFISAENRISLFSIHIGSLLMVFYYIKVQKKEIKKLSVLLFLIVILSLYHILFFEVRSLVGQVIIFSYSLLLYVSMNNYQVLKYKILRYYILAVKLIAFCSILSIFYYYMATSGILNKGMLIVREGFMDSMLGMKFGYNYKFTPFGIIIEKDFFIPIVPRALFYLTEPLSLAGLCALNMSTLHKYSKVWWLNFLCGISTLSFLFYVFLFVYIFWNKRYLFLLTILPIYIFLDDIFLHSSLSPRIESMHMFVEQVLNYNSINQLLFGTGYNPVGYPSGVMFLIDEIGIIGLLIVFILASFYYQKNSLLLFTFVLCMFVMPIYKYPVYWFVFIIMGMFPKKNYVINDSFNLIRHVRKSEI
jgi:hypothetical protein